MRRIGLFVVGAAVILASVSWVEGQQQEEKKKKGGGFGGLGGLLQPQRLDPLALLRNASVKKELDVSDDQMEKLTPEVLNAIAKVLSDKQMKRFREIELQQRKNDAFKDPTVQAALKMTDEQKKSVTGLLDDARKEIADLRTGAGAGGFQALQANREKIDTITKDTKEKIYSVLSSEQRKTFRGLLGEEFKIETPTFNFGNLGNFKGKKKAE